MSIDIYFENDSDDRVVGYIRHIGSAVVKALQREMERQMIRLQTHVVADKLSGQSLKVKTGTLRRAVHYNLVTTESAVIGKVVVDPSASKYGRVHEYGGTVSVREHLRASKTGSYTVRSHHATYPQRSFLRTALRDQAASLRTGLVQAVHNALQEIK